MSALIYNSTAPSASGYTGALFDMEVEFTEE